MSRNFLVVDPEEDIEVLKGLASPIRVRILKLLHMQGAMNGNDIAEKLDLPQSTVSTNIQILEGAG
ncbi:MAG: helix-turn-helix domain-containing protein, partial [Kaiparowitsia implicata GSE-PSE-MK54-09C]|nr:helix-turn-helix domain-containing protein [Kaiparowitsia implicata GSE-PSE-MK54-09C]